MHHADNIRRIALGTAQFGLDYGIANHKGQVSLGKAKVILRYAHDNGLDTLDTAMAYGDAERRLGEIGIGGWRVVSKLPVLPKGTSSVANWVTQVVADSLQRLRTERLYGLLLHRPDDLLSSRGKTLYGVLQGLKTRGLVEKIGISVYGPDELDNICNHFDVDLVQAPLNVLDRRLVESGWLSRLLRRGTEVHVRSVFLQGLLLMPAGSRPARFRRWQELWDRWQTWLASTGLSPLSACLGFALNQPGIDRVIVGVEDLSQLQEILTAASVCIPALPDDLCSGDLDLINPSRWHFP